MEYFWFMVQGSWTKQAAEPSARFKVISGGSLSLSGAD